ncbi:MAG: HPr family phosphocarrier protein [Clostridiales bacterium]|jgi:phosphotransferase system HPr (HPr) family protein|nr:HPr family phosphocarrier protein [Clostridiales bacterium]
MIEQSLKVAASLEARSAALFVQTANRFASSIQLSVDDKTVNAKSIMGVISLGLLDGQDVKIIADGADEKQAVERLERFLSAVSV